MLLVKKSFNLNVKTFRSNNGSKFVNVDLKQIFSENGIVHQTTCSYTL